MSETNFSAPVQPVLRRMPRWARRHWGKHPPRKAAATYRDGRCPRRISARRSSPRLAACRDGRGAAGESILRAGPPPHAAMGDVRDEFQRAGPARASPHAAMGAAPLEKASSAQGRRYMPRWAMSETNFSAPVQPAPRRMPHTAMGAAPLGKASSAQDCRYMPAGLRASADLRAPFRCARALPPPASFAHTS